MLIIIIIRIDDEQGLRVEMLSENVGNYAEASIYQGIEQYRNPPFVYELYKTKAENCE